MPRTYCSRIEATFDLSKYLALTTSRGARGGISTLSDPSMCGVSCCPVGGSAGGLAPNVSLVMVVTVGVPLVLMAVVEVPGSGVSCSSKIGENKIIGWRNL